MVRGAPAKRPLIALAARPRREGQVSGWPDTAASVMQNTYTDAIWRAGGQDCIVAPRLITADEARSLIMRVDGLLLVGGGDVDPARYGAEADPAVYGVEERSDVVETELVLAAIELRRPTLAICRGLQVLNVALGGSLDQHITDRAGLGRHGQPGVGRELHSVEVAPGSLLSCAAGGAAVIENCWSYHHQAIAVLATGLAVTARSADGVIEAVELRDVPGRDVAGRESPGWLIAVQWHPERTASDDPVQQGLFDSLIDAAASRSGLR